MEGAIVLGSRTGGRLELTPAQSPHKGLRDWIVRLEGEGLDANALCSEAGWLPEDLSSFFMRLATNTDWKSEESWCSAEGELRLTASHPKTNTVLIRAILNVQAPCVWTAETEVEIDPGAFVQAADDIRRAAERFPID